MGQRTKTFMAHLSSLQSCLYVRLSLETSGKSDIHAPIFTKVEMTDFGSLLKNTILKRGRGKPNLRAQMNTMERRKLIN